MTARKKGNKLENWEVSLVKAMIEDDRWPNDQDILAYFSRPLRSINHRAISEIRRGAKHAGVASATASDLTEFIANWPDVDSETGLSIKGDELLIKAREAMIAAVHTFNSAGLTFRAELFIVTSIISWTYLLHAWFRREGIDYRHTVTRGGEKRVSQTPSGADKYWELGQCLRHAKCPLEKGVRDNLEFLLEIRHEIEHRSTDRIDEAISAKLQACCINFNDAMKAHFGEQYALERRLSVALQFVTFGPDHLAILKKAPSLPANIEAVLSNYDRKLTPEQQADPRFAFRVYMIGRTAKRAPGADIAVELIQPDSPLADQVNRILLKETEKRKYLPSQIVSAMRDEGFDKFTMHKHTELWKQLDAKVPDKGFGVVAVGNVWSWYDTWLTRVREECEKNPNEYRSIE